MPTQGSSDYFNSCSDHFDSGLGYCFFCVPENAAGYQEARTGQAYGGYFTGILPVISGYQEYLSVQLSKPLIEQKMYKLTYYLSLADGKDDVPLQYFNHSAAYFSIDTSFFNSTDKVLLVNPQVVSDPNIFLNDSTGWQKIEGTFVANGGEQFLTIGSFTSFENVAYNFLNSDSSVSSYFYIDDVSLIQVEDFIPNVFTPNGDDINDYVDFTEFIGSKIQIINRWGNTVLIIESQSNYLWYGMNYLNEQLSSGIYYYIIEQQDNKKTGTIHLIR